MIPRSIQKLEDSLPGGFSQAFGNYLFLSILQGLAFYFSANISQFFWLTMLNCIIFSFSRVTTDCMVVIIHGGKEGNDTDTE